VLALLLSLTALAVGYGPDDVCGPVDIRDARIAPDGSAVVFVVRSCTLDADKRHSDLWHVAADGQPRRLTTHPASDHSPVWSPDGSALAFLSSRGGSTQVWRFDGFFGEPAQVSHQPGGVSEVVWTPDGEQLLIVSRGPEKERDPLAGEDVGVHRDLLYRKGPYWEDGRYAQVYRVPASGGGAVQLTESPHDHGELAVSPDGSTVAVVRQPEHPGGVVSIDTDVWLVPVDGGPARQLTDNPGPDHTPRWAPDGQVVLTRSVLEPGYESGRRRLMLWPVDGGAPRELTEGLDRSVFRVEFAPDGSVLGVLDGPGTWHLARLSPERPGEVEWLSEGRSWVWGLDVARSGATALVVADASHPSEVWLLDRLRPAVLDWEAPRRVRRLTELSTPFTDTTELSEPEAHWIDVPAGRRVQAWYYPPVGWEGDGPPPLILTLHGGPQWCEGDRWDPDLQALAGGGYAVLAVNFTGSTGYGQDFVDAITGDWGGAPAEDALAAVDWAVRTGRADPERLGVTGGSYGGFLAAHLITQTERFAAAAVCRGVSHQISQFGVTDEQFFHVHDTPGTPWSHPDHYRRWSPVLGADAIRTPTLIVHSDDDYRVPVSQAEELFTALLVNGVEAKLVRFPGEGHGLRWHGTPVHRRERLRHLLDWFDTHLAAP